MFANTVSLVETIGWCLFLTMVMFSLVLYVRNR